jgi:hypothetical protein
MTEWRAKQNVNSRYFSPISERDYSICQQRIPPESSCSYQRDTCLQSASEGKHREKRPEYTSFRALSLYQLDNNDLMAEREGFFAQPINTGHFADSSTSSSWAVPFCHQNWHT